MREDLTLCDFTKGELSPRLKGRTDYKGYYSGLATALNIVIMAQGGWTRRPGTMLKALAKDQSDGAFRVREEIDFVFGTPTAETPTPQAYQVEVGAGYLRIDTDNAPIVNIQGVTGAANNGAGLVRLALASTTGLQTGNSMTVSGVAGTVEANGAWFITVIDGTHVDLQGSAFAHAYGGGGSTSTLVEIDFYAALGVPLAVTGAAGSGGLIELTLNATASLATGQDIIVAGVLGTVEANGTWPVTIVDGTHVTLQGSAFANAYASGGVATPLVQKAVPYQAGDIASLGWCQSQDTLYLTHPSYPTMALTRSSNTNWALTQIQFRDGPYLNAPAAVAALTCSAASGAITITASGALGLNATPQNVGQGFLATDVGRLIRIGDGAGNFGWCVITGWTSPTQVAAVVMGAVNLGAGATVTTGATTTWQLGKWSATTGYPWLPMFWQQRLNLLGTNTQISAFEGSVTADFTNFAPSATGGGTVVPSNAISWVISDDEVNAIRWVAPAGSAAAMQLGIGTANGEYILQPATTSAALANTNVQVYRETSYGNAPNVRALRIGKEVLMVDPPGRQVHAWQWQWAVNGYLGPNRTVDSEHITRPVPVNGATPQGIVQMVYQQNPYGVIWANRGDGALIGTTYLPEQQIFGAWHRHQLGGQYYGGPPLVESVCVTPSPDGTYSELSLVVLRTIAGVVTRTKEVMTRYFDAMPREQAWFMDCASQSALTVPNATLTPPALANNNAPGAAGALVDLAPSFGAPGSSVEFAASAAVFTGTAADVGSYLRVNNGVFEVTAPVDTQHVMAQCWIPMTNSKPAASGDWSCTAQETAFSGLDYLNGETAGILGDGADFGQQVVAGGAVTLPDNGTASLATVGLPTYYASIGMPFDPERAAGPDAQGKQKRIDHLYLRFHESLGCNFGVRVTDDMTFLQQDLVEAIETRSAADLMGAAPALFSGIIELPSPGGYDKEQQIEISGDGPMPCSVLSLGAKADVGEMEQG